VFGGRIAAVPIVNTSEPAAAQLVKDAQSGDTSAFAQLYQRYAGMVHLIAMSRLPSDEIADVVQETFLRALCRLKSLRVPEAFGPWLSSIARNIVFDVERKRAAAVAQDEEPLHTATQHEDMQAGAAVRAIRTLPKAYRKTIAMRVLHGMTGPEIARRTGLTVGSVRVNLHRGMKLLRERMESRTVTNAKARALFHRAGHDV
jgi:RNA polymerase sigma-70 factor (ECF subfamily)